MPKKLSPAIFGIIIICFFLPWVNVSCQRQKIASFTGMQLVTGTTIDQPGMFGAAEKRKVGGEALALMAFLSGVAGIGLGFLKNKSGKKLSAVAGGAGIILLLMLKSKLSGDLDKQSMAMIQLEYIAGFYLTLLSFVSAMGVNIYSIMQDKVPLPIRGKSKADEKFCSQCGTKAETESTFCSKCGHSLR